MTYSLADVRSATRGAIGYWGDEKIAQKIEQIIAESSKALSESSQLQVEAMEQADAGITRISEIVQNNSATSQELSSAIAVFS